MATDQQCKTVLDTWGSLHDQIVGYSTPKESSNGTKWGAPHYIRDHRLTPGKQELWRGDSRDEMLDRVEVERMRVALDAAFQDDAVALRAALKTISDKGQSGEWTLPSSFYNFAISSLKNGMGE